MVSERKQQLLLGALAVVLLVVGYRAWPHTAATRSAPSNEGRSAATTGSRSGTHGPTAPDVHLDTLDAARPAPAPTTRNLFRFKPTAPPAAAASRATERPLAGLTGPPPPPSVPPIPLKFIGFVGSPQQKIVALRDPAGHVDYGAEGSIIGGRYRVLRIGEESVELAYLDGSGRQTIRLSGS